MPNGILKGVNTTRKILYSTSFYLMSASSFLNQPTSNIWREYFIADVDYNNDLLREAFQLVILNQHARFLLFTSADTYGFLEGIEFGSNPDGTGSGQHFLPHFNTNTNVVRYEYKTDSSDLDTYSDITKCQQHVSIYFINSVIIRKLLYKYG